MQWLGLLADPSGTTTNLTMRRCPTVTVTFQLDIRAGMGLKRHAADFFAGSGFAEKY